jgi:hypothetical protein
MSRKLVIIVATIFVFGVVVGGLRWYVLTHTMPAAHPCVNNLRVISAAKQQWAFEHNKTAQDTPTWEDLRPYFPAEWTNGRPICPDGGTYTIGRVGEPPKCSLGEKDPLYHSLPN